MSHTTLAHQVHAEIAAVLDLMPYDVTPEADLRENFGLTPTDRQQIRTAIHKAFGVFLPLDHVQGPFTGIGSEGYEAVRLGRRFVGFELKPQYAEVAAKNLHAAVAAKSQGSLFDAASLAG